MESMGWRVVVVWACRFRNKATTAELEHEMQTWFDGADRLALVAEDPSPYKLSQRKTKPKRMPHSPRMRKS